MLPIFSIFGTCEFVHSDRGSAFIANDFRTWLLSKNIACSSTCPYNPKGNGQCEKYNGVIWKAVELALKSKGLPIHRWEQVLPEVLHSQRSLLCTATGETPHDRLFAYQRRSVCGASLPNWLLKPGKVLLRKFVRNSKYEPSVIKVDLLEANFQYAKIRYGCGRESTVSIRDLAPCGALSINDHSYDLSKRQIDMFDEENVNTPTNMEGENSFIQNNTEVGQNAEIETRQDLDVNMDMDRNDDAIVSVDKDVNSIENSDQNENSVEVQGIADSSVTNNHSGKRIRYKPSKLQDPNFVYN